MGESGNMKRVVERVRFNTLPELKLKRVAAYTRVSCGKDAMLHSLSAQVSYYRNLIQENPEWEYVGVFTDEGITGTKATRPGFQYMLKECRDGKIDMIITKSISRFARNTVTLLETVRELKSLGVDVFFEEQNIHTMSGDGELVLTFLTSFAQEESRSVSENMKWRVKQNFENGKPWNCTMLGYRNANGVLIVVPEEAETVKRIFREYLAGKGRAKIAKELNDDGILTRHNRKWSKSSIERLLHNYSYTGNLLLQTTYNENHLTKKRMENIGQLPKYHAIDTHEAIISLEDFNKAQDVMKQRSGDTTVKKTDKQTYTYTGLITCGCCGKHYRRKVSKGKVIWLCGTYATYGRSCCSSKQIPEAILDELIPDITVVSKIIAKDDNTLDVYYTDGSMESKKWQNRSRASSWTPEMKEQARQKQLERMKKK